MIDIYGVANHALTLLPDNLHLGQENITIFFQIDGTVTGADDLGNPVRDKTSVTVEGLARIDGDRDEEQQLPGTDNKYLALRVNVTKVDGTATTSLPVAIAPKMVGAATYTQSNSTTIVGQFMVQPSLSKVVSKVHEKVGDIVYGTLEITGDGR